MASEPSDGGSVSVSLPSELQDWLETQATQLGVDEETVVEQLLASYRAADRLDGEGAAVVDPDAVEPDAAVVEEMVRETIRERLDDIAAAVEERVEGDASSEEFQAELDRIESTLGDRIDRTESNFRDKLEDVRERVIQVKRETDGKAPQDHGHPELQDRIESVESTVRTLRAELESSLDDVDERLDELDDVDEQRDELGDVDERLADVEQKLRTVAWVVSDLRDAHEEDGATDDTVKRLKRTAAEEGFDRAQCENCSNAVQLSLLTEPNCPHCDATVSTVEASSGFFGRPRLVVAKQLEPGENDAGRMTGRGQGG